MVDELAKSVNQLGTRPPSIRWKVLACGMLWLCAVAGNLAWAASPRRVILDVDPGIDDAMALLLAFQSPELQVEAVTVVAGNVPVELGAENALKLAELAGAWNVPVARGAERPLLRRLTTAEAVHGENGLGGLELPAPKKALDPRHAVEVIVQTVRAHPGEITLVPVGPLTNVALALRQAPDLRTKVREIVLMGGAVHGGNVTPVAEANIHNDAEAAQIVFGSGIPIVMVGLDATSQVVLTRQHLARLRESSSPLAKAVASMAEHYVRFYEGQGRQGALMHDPLAVGLAMDRTFATLIQPAHVSVETRGEFTYGQTVVNFSLQRTLTSPRGDRDTIGPVIRLEPNAQIPLQIDAERFLTLFLDRITAPPRPATPSPSATGGTAKRSS